MYVLFMDYPWITQTSYSSEVTFFCTSVLCSIILKNNLLMNDANSAYLDVIA